MSFAGLKNAINDSCLSFARLDEGFFAFEAGVDMAKERS